MLNVTQTDEAQWNFWPQIQVSSTFLKAVSFGSLPEDTVNLEIPFSRGIIWPFSACMSTKFQLKIWNNGLFLEHIWFELARPTMYYSVTQLSTYILIYSLS